METVQYLPSCFYYCHHKEAGLPFCVCTRCVYMQSEITLNMHRLYSFSNKRHKINSSLSEGSEVSRLHTHVFTPLSVEKNPHKTLLKL